MLAAFELAELGLAQFNLQSLQITEFELSGSCLAELTNYSLENY